MSDFIFCPRCGAVTKPGICTNCGYNTEKERVSENTAEENTSYDNSSSDYSYDTISSASENTSSFSYATGSSSNENASSFSYDNGSSSNEGASSFSYDNGSSDFSYDNNSSDSLKYDNGVSPVSPETIKETKPKKEKKSGTGLIIGVVAGIIVLLFLIIVCVVILCFGAFPAVYKYFSASNNQAVVPPTNNPVTPSTNIPDIDVDIPDIDTNLPDLPDVTDPDDDKDQIYNGYSELIEPNYGGTSQFDWDSFIGDYTADANEFTNEEVTEEDDYFINGPYSSYSRSGSSHEFIERDGFETPYYEHVLDSFIPNDNYDVKRNVMRYEAEVDGLYVNAYCGYYTLESDTVDFTAVNEQLRDQSISALYYYLENNDAEDGTFYTLYSDSIITFNNDEIFSVVYDINSYEGNNTKLFYLHGVNVDVKNGQVMDNTQILNFDDDFTKFFIQRSNTQNSTVPAINGSDISDTTKLFNNDDSLILFFTPLGVEVGINYRYYGSFGWVTVTLNDFDKYFSGTYDFDTDFGKGYDIYKYEKDMGITTDDFNYDDDDETDL